MSDLPKIYAHCPAGCKYETVHKEDFLASACLISLPIDEAPAGTKLDAGCTYKVFAPFIEGELNFSASISLVFSKDEKNYNTELNGFLNGADYYRVVNVNQDEYAESFTFKFVAIKNENGVGITYEISGNRYFKRIEDLASDSDVTVVGIFLTGDISKLFIYNADATIVATGEKGADGKDGSNGKSINYLNAVISENFGEVTTCSLLIEADVKVDELIVSSNGYLGKVTAYEERYNAPALGVSDGYWEYIYSVETLAKLKGEQGSNGKGFNISYHTISLLPENWEADTEINPFSYKIANTSSSFTEMALIELLCTNNASEIVKYGIMLGKQEGNTIYFYAIDKPTEELQLMVGVTTYD